MIPRLRSLDDIFIEFSQKWSFLWGGQTGEKGVGKYDIEADIVQSLEDAYDMGFQEGRAEGIQAASDWGPPP